MFSVSRGPTFVSSDREYKDTGVKERKGDCNGITNKIKLKEKRKEKYVETSGLSELLLLLFSEKYCTIRCSANTFSKQSLDKSIEQN